MKWLRIGEGSGGALLKKAAVALTSLPSRRISARSYQTIKAIPREVVDKRLVYDERDWDQIPAVVSDPIGGPSPASRKQLLTIDGSQISSTPYAYTTVFNLQVYAGPGSSQVVQSGTVLPIKVDQCKVTGEILSVALVWVEEGGNMKVVIPLVYKGVDVCPGLKKGGYLLKLRTSLKYLCPTKHIPQMIEVDLTNLDIGDKVLARDVKVHPSLKLMSKSDMISICKITDTKPAKRKTFKKTSLRCMQPPVFW